MGFLSTTYWLPAILLNPAFILHLINTFVSYLVPPVPSISVSPHPMFESLGPLPGSKPYLNMHADDQLCWTYTGIMVFIQLLAFGRVQDNRGKRKSARAARKEKERLSQENADLEAVEARRLVLLRNDEKHLWELPNGSMLALANGATVNGTTNGAIVELSKAGTPETEGSVTGTSDEDMIV